MQTTRTEIECAIAAGIGVSLPLYLVFTGPKLMVEPNPFTAIEAGFILLIFAGYAVTPFLYQPIKGCSFSKWIPVWVFIAFWGSFSFVLADYLFELSFFYFFGWKFMLIEFVYLSVYTMSVAGIVYYSGSIVRRLRRWQANEHENLSILRK